MYEAVIGVAAAWRFARGAEFPDRVAVRLDGRHLGKGAKGAKSDTAFILAPLCVVVEFQRSAAFSRLEKGVALNVGLNRKRWRQRLLIAR